MTELPVGARDRRATAASALRALTAVLVLGALAAVLLLTGCSNSSDSEAASPAESSSSTEQTTAGTTAPGVLYVASALNNDPYEQETATSQNGFTVDLLELIGERMGLEVEFGHAVNHKAEDQSITEGTPADVAAKVAAGDADLGASSIPVTESLEGVTFTEPYLHADWALITKDSAGYNDAASLEGTGVKVAVSSDEAAAWVAERFPEAEVLSFDHNLDAMMEVNSERAQAAVVDEPRLKRYVKVKEPHLQIIETTPLSVDYAFVASADNGALVEAVNEALAQIQADGSYDELYESWFGEAPAWGSATRSAPEAVDDSTGA